MPPQSPEAFAPLPPPEAIQAERLVELPVVSEHAGLLALRYSDTQIDESPPESIGINPAHLAESAYQATDDVLKDRLEKDPALRFVEREVSIGRTAATFLKSAERSSLGTSVDVTEGQAALNELVFETINSELVKNAREHLKNAKESSPDAYQKTLESAGIDPDTELSASDILAFYKVRERRLGAIDLERAPVYEEYKNGFGQQLEASAEKGLPVDLENARKKLELTRIHAVDSMLMNTDPSQEQETTEGIISMGHFSARVSGGGSVGIADSSVIMNNGNTRKVAFHELVHATAGRREFRSNRVRTQGLSVNNRHTWLDEAVTEELAEVLFEAEKTGIMPDFHTVTTDEFIKQSKLETGRTYINERRALKTILSGLPEGSNQVQILLAAYYEDKNPVDRSGSSAHRELLQMLNGQENLAKLDTAYRDIGSKALLGLAESRER